MTIRTISTFAFILTAFSCQNDEVNKTDSHVQIDSLFKVQVGIFKCWPNYKLQDSTYLSLSNSSTGEVVIYDDQVLSEEPQDQSQFLIHSGPINPMTLNFPNRNDSIIEIKQGHDSNGKVEEIVSFQKTTSNDHEFNNIHDSVCSSQLDKFWQSTIAILNKDKNQKFKGCGIFILYSNGSNFYIPVDNPNLLENVELKKELKKHLPILAISISDIWFEADNKKDYFIVDGFGWKIINCH